MQREDVNAAGGGECSEREGTSRKVMSDGLSPTGGDCGRPPRPRSTTAVTSRRRTTALSVILLLIGCSHFTWCHSLRALSSRAPILSRILSTCLSRRSSPGCRPCGRRAAEHFCGGVPSLLIVQPATAPSASVSLLACCTSLAATGTNSKQNPRSSGSTPRRSSRRRHASPRAASKHRGRSRPPVRHYD